MSWHNDQVSKKDTDLILRVAKECLKTASGDFVEFGCYKGDTSLLLAELLKNSQNKIPRLWLYDSFEGLPIKTTPDETEKSPEFQKGALLTSKRTLKLRFLRANFPVPIIKKAWFNDLKSDDLPKKISFAFLDGDFYESIKTSLALTYPRLEQNGIIIIHDYKNDKLPGVRTATDEFFKSHFLLKSQSLFEL